jgi:DNA-3-methyladenine glycosylase
VETIGISGCRFARAWFARPTLDVARDLLGCLLISAVGPGRTVGRIVETEAYLGPGDSASHAARLRTERVAAMSRTPGIAYVYRSYGIHTMLNVVAKPDDETGAVLIRAIEPLAGIELMAERRGVPAPLLLASGPGRLCQALGVTLDDHGTDLVTSERVWLEVGEPPAAIATSGRIGISRATEHPWRFFVADNPYVSGPRQATPGPAALPDHGYGAL